MINIRPFQRRILLKLKVAILVGVAACLSASARASSVVITGRTVDQSIKPVGDVYVTVTGLNTTSVQRAEATTDSNGEFKLTLDTTASSVGILIYKKDLLSVDLTPVPVPPTNAIAIGQIILKPVDWPFISDLRKSGFQLRKTFDGSKDESEPAEVSWAHHSTLGKSSYWNVNAAAKITEWYLGNVGSIYPIVEWHHVSKGTDETNKLTFKLASQFQLPTGDSGGPVIIPSISGNRDFVADKWGDSESVLTSWYDIKKGLPGSDIRFLDYTFLFRYFPYIGAERFNSSAVPGEPAVLGNGRLALELYWFSRRDRSLPIASFNASYTYRLPIDVGDEFPRNPYLIRVGSTVYVDPGGHLGLGFSFQRGRDPNDNFKFDSQESVGLRIKL